ncbi:MAG: MerR family DNA-binding transcriptional regulator [Nitriliruptoraceae bacterium]
MARTATTEQVAAALHVGPAAVRKYARERRIPYDTTPGGHRRYDVAEAVAAIRGDTGGADEGLASGSAEDVGEVPYVWVRPEQEVAVRTLVTSVTSARVPVHDDPCDVEDQAADTSVV